MSKKVKVEVKKASVVKDSSKNQTALNCQLYSQLPKIKIK